MLKKPPDTFVFTGTKKYGTVTITPASAYSSNYTIAYTDSSGEQFTQKINANIIALSPTTNRTTAQTMDVINRHLENGSVKLIEDIELDVYIEKEDETPIFDYCSYSRIISDILENAIINLIESKTKLIREMLYEGT